jgi:glycosyltransferase involved in cell wall biosynthesis
MKVVINAVSAKLGGAATYVRNLALSLRENPPAGDEFLFIVPPGRAAELRNGAGGDARIRVLESGAAGGSYAARWWWEQVTLRRLLARERPDVLFSSANFAMLACPSPQVLLVRIPIYFSAEYIEHVLPHKSATFRLETALRRWLVCRSVRAADCLMTPTAAMRDDLARFARVDAGRTVVNAYGVPDERVGRASAAAARNGRAAFRLLWVSHYADHKNLATLLRAVLLLRGDAALPKIELWLTLDAEAQRGQHTPLPPAERELLASLGDTVKLLGVRSYEETWKLYEQCDLFLFPSLCESFGHPLVEAMASGLPIVASDVAVHREICGEAAAYFPVLEATTLAQTLRGLMLDSPAREALAANGSQRVQSFLWNDHVARLLALWRELAACGSAASTVADAASNPARVSAREGL